MSKDSNTQRRTTRQHPPTKIIVERHYVGTEKMEPVFKRIAEEQITKKVNYLVIDEVTAPVVELIFSIAEEGVGLHTICSRLHKAKVLKPSFYKKELFERFMDEKKIYGWDTAYVSQILHNPVYAGNLTVADKPTKTMRSKNRQYIPFAEREVIYGTHEPNPCLS